MATDICMIVENNVTNDGRVLREATSLAAHGWRVTVLGASLGGSRLPKREAVRGFNVLHITPPVWDHTTPGKREELPQRTLAGLMTSAMELYYLRRVDARVYHAHDFSALLMVALAGIWRRPVVYDSHELYFDRCSPDARLAPSYRYILRHLRPLEKILARRAAAVITVGDGVADRLAQTLDVPRPLVVRNAVDIRAMGPPAAAYETDGRKAIVHSGGMTGGRHLPELVAALAHLPDDVALVLMGDGPLRPRLVAQAEALGVAERLLVVPPVPPGSVAATLAQADAAAVLITSQAMSYDLSLPNKLFEAIAAGLPLVSGSSKEIAALVRQYDLGIVCDPADPLAIAAAIRTILQPENQARYRANVRKAREVFNWENEERKLIALYRDIFNLNASIDHDR